MNVKQDISQEFAAKFYTNLYKTATFPLSRLRRSRFKEINSLIHKYAPKAQSILDYGGGDGALYLFIDQKEEYQIIDIATTHKYTCEIPKSHRLAFNKDWTIPSKDNSFDVVVISEVLEHLHNPLITLIEVKRVLKKKGILIITVPNAFSFYFIFKSLFGKYMDPSFEHVALYDYSHLNNMLMTIGFKQKEHYTKFLLFGKIYDSLLGWADPFLSKIFPHNNIQLLTVFQKGS